VVDVCNALTVTGSAGGTDREFDRIVAGFDDRGRGHSPAGRAAAHPVPLAVLLVLLVMWLCVPAVVMAAGWAGLLIVAMALAVMVRTAIPRSSRRR
jgi:hypothetical protein